MVLFSLLRLVVLMFWLFDFGCFCLRWVSILLGLFCLFSLCIAAFVMRIVVCCLLDVWLICVFCC